MFSEKHLIPRLGSLPLQKLSAAHLNAAYADMLVSGRRNGEGRLPRAAFASRIVPFARRSPTPFAGTGSRATWPMPPTRRGGPPRGARRRRGQPPSSAASSCTFARPVSRRPGASLRRRGCAGARFSGSPRRSSILRYVSSAFAGRSPQPTTSLGSHSQRRRRDAVLVAQSPAHRSRAQ